MICLDSSLVLKALTKEGGSDETLDILEKFIRKRERFVAPLLLEYEVYSGLRRKAYLGELEEFRILAALDFFYKLQIEVLHQKEYLREALFLSRQLSLPTIYDCSFLAVAIGQGCLLYTADARFVKAASSLYPNHVRFYLE